MIDKNTAFPDENGHGWVKVPRSLESTWVFENPKYLMWYTLILLRVNYKSTEVLLNSGPFTVQPGQSINSLDRWREIFGCSKGAAHRFLTNLSTTGLITRQNIGKGNRTKLLISVVSPGNSGEKVTGNGTPNGTPNGTLYKKGRKKEENNQSENSDFNSPGDTSNRPSRKKLT